MGFTEKFNIQGGGFQKTIQKGGPGGGVFERDEWYPNAHYALIANSKQI